MDAANSRAKKSLLVLGLFSPAQWGTLNIAWTFFALLLLLYIALVVPVRSVFWQPRHFYHSDSDSSSATTPQQLLHVVEAIAANGSGDFDYDHWLMLEASNNSSTTRTNGTCATNDSMRLWFGMDWFVDVALLITCALKYCDRHYQARRLGDGRHDHERTPSVLARCKAYVCDNERGWHVCIACPSSFVACARTRQRV